jgi:hypothetical protein
MEEYQQDEGRESVFQEGGCQTEAVSRPCTEQNENRTHERNEAAPMQTSPRMLTQFVGVTSWVLAGGVTTKCCVESSFEFRVVRGSERSKAGKNQTVEEGRCRERWCQAYAGRRGSQEVQNAITTWSRSHHCKSPNWQWASKCDHHCIDIIAGEIVVRNNRRQR